MWKAIKERGPRYSGSLGGKNKGRGEHRRKLRCPLAQSFRLWMKRLGPWAAGLCVVTEQISGLCTSPTELYFCPRRLHPLRPPLENLHVILNLPCVLFRVPGNIGSLELAIAAVFTQQELATNQYLGSFPRESVVKRLPAHHYLKRPLFLPHKDTLIPLMTLSVSISLSCTHIGSCYCAVFLPKRVLSHLPNEPHVSGLI